MKWRAILLILSVVIINSALLRRDMPEKARITTKQAGSIIKTIKTYLKNRCK